MLRILTIFLLLCVPLLQSCQQETESRLLIVSTIKPIQALVYAVAGDANQELELQQLLPDGTSPHHYALKPSDMRTLENARVIFRIDSGLETFLDKPLTGLGSHTHIVTLADTPGLQHLPNRLPHYHAENHEDTHQHDETPPTNSSKDLHLWLNPQNAIAMTHEIARVLAQADPAHREDYANNAAQLVQRIQTTDAQIRQQLEPLRGRPYLSFHDAWQHFDTHYDLNFAGAVTLDVARSPGARHVSHIRQIIADKQAVCLFEEPQFSPALIKTLVENSSIHLGQVDPLGVGLPLDDKTYTVLLQNAANSFADCLR